MLCSIYGKGLQEGYLILRAIAPLLVSFGAFVDVFVSALVSLLVAREENVWTEVRRRALSEAVGEADLPRDHELVQVGEILPVPEMKDGMHRADGECEPEAVGQAPCAEQARLGVQEARHAVEVSQARQRSSARPAAPGSRSSGMRTRRSSPTAPPSETLLDTGKAAPALMAEKRPQNEEAFPRLARAGHCPGARGLVPCPEDDGRGLQEERAPEREGKEAPSDWVSRIGVGPVEGSSVSPIASRPGSRSPARG